MNYYLEIIIGCMLLIYGIVKLVIGSIVCFFPTEWKKTMRSVDGIGFFISNDDTIAGKAFDIALMTFGIYTIIHGLDMLHILHISISDAILNRTFLYLMNAILGIYLLVFYSLVIFTNVNIPKKKDHKDRYMIEGLCSGLLFLITIPLLIIFYSIHDNGFTNANWTLIGGMIVCSIFIMVLVLYIVKKALTQKHKPTTTQEILEVSSLLLIPLASTSQ